MFKISLSTTYTWPVTVSIPVDGGKFETKTFTAKFRRLSREQVEKITNLVADGQMTEVDFCLDIMEGWSGIADEDGELEFSPGALKDVLSIPGTGGSIAAAFYESVQGAKRKN